ncbi:MULTISPECIES: phage baseplate plug family protein [Sodalis]|jgi:hypothetical protein|uniref:Cyanophage baseplate Pam3 plug gp18 domain-containing protein n=1 Tax=Sodalis ligni TaxID=2697027 RepID=A0A4R1NA02_9GAMM|nr:hypothetical protein [Sodalis ligni]TCL04215.1 hypothetical protein EZJ58_2326 [Sodalis ligni]
MAIQEIPLTADNQTFYIKLAGTLYKMTLLWRDSAGWILDIADSAGNALIQGIPLVINVDLLAQYAYLGFNGRLMVMLDDDDTSLPTITGLGSTSHVYFIIASSS